LQVKADAFDEVFRLNIEIRFTKVKSIDILSPYVKQAQRPYVELRRPEFAVDVKLHLTNKHACSQEYKFGGQRQC